MTPRDSAGGPGDLDMDLKFTTNSQSFDVISRHDQSISL